MKKEKGECSNCLSGKVASVSLVLRTASPAMCCNVRGNLLLSYVSYCAFTSQMHAFLLYDFVRRIIQEA